MRIYYVFAAALQALLAAVNAWLAMLQGNAWAWLNWAAFGFISVLALASLAMAADDDL